MSTNALVLTVLGFLLGSLMWSYWLGKLVLRRDIRELGDGNPGAFNLMRTGKLTVAGVGMFLDIGKGVIPAGLAMTFLPVSGWELVPVAIAPVIGHAFSPWMRFRGGKAVAATAGVQMGLHPLFTGLIGLPVFVGSYLLMNTSGWAIAVTVTILLIAQILLGESAPVLVIWLIQSGLLLYKYRADLRQPIGLRSKRRTPPTE